MTAGQRVRVSTSAPGELAGREGIVLERLGDATPHCGYWQVALLDERGRQSRLAEFFGTELEPLCATPLLDSLPA